MTNSKNNDGIVSGQRTQGHGRTNSGQSTLATTKLDKHHSTTKDVPNNIAEGLDDEEEDDDDVYVLDDYYDDEEWCGEEGADDEDVEGDD